MRYVGRRLHKQYWVTGLGGHMGFINCKNNMEFIKPGCFYGFSNSIKGEEFLNISKFTAALLMLR